MIKMEAVPPPIVRDMSPQDQERYLVLLAQLKKNLQEGFRALAIMAVIGIFCLYQIFVEQDMIPLTIYALISWAIVIVSHFHFKKLRLLREPIIQELDQILAKYQPPQT